MAMEKCPAECGRYRRVGMLLCAVCWRKVPRDLQREVYATWDAYTAVLNDDHTPIAEAGKPLMTTIQQYAEAARKALHAAKGEEW